jgi:hypothetical protein
MLFKVNGSYATISAFWDSQVLPVFKKAAPNAPLTVWPKIKENIYVSSLIELEIPLFDKYYTQSEIEQLITFYKSPIGQKFAKVQAPMTVESTKIGAEWGKTVGKKIIAELKKEGYIKNQ